MIQIAAPDLSALTKRLGSLSKVPARDFKRVMSSTKRATETQTKRAIADNYGVQQRRAAKDIKSSNVAGNPPFFTITGRNKPIGLLNFSARVSKRSGASVIVTKKRGRTKLQSAFIANSNGATLLFERNGEFRVMQKGRYKGRVREAIEPMFGPSVADMLKNKTVFDRIEIFALSKMSAELERVIAGILKNRG